MSIDTGSRNGTGRGTTTGRTTPGRSPAAGPPGATDVELPRLPGRRNPKWIALGVVALCLGALLSYVVYDRVASESTVVAMATTVYRGEAIEAADLTTVRLRSGSLAGTVPESELDGLVGRRAVFDLPAGGVLAAGSVADTAVPVEGRAAVGILLANGTAPQTLLLPSAPIRLVALPPASTDTQAGSDKLAGKTYRARVISQTAGADGASVMLDVDVEQSQAPTIALLAAQQRIAVVRDAGR